MRKLLISLCTVTAVIVALTCCCLNSAGEAPGAVEWLGDNPDLILTESQGWGELGLNTAAHDKNLKGEPLKVGDTTYAKGLGHHANGHITVLSEGEFSAFDAEVGLQPCGGHNGSVIFRVMVDGEKRFDSGVMRERDAAKPVHVDLAGAQEVILEVNDAGDGVICDMANWANARLTRASVAARRALEPSVNIAPFARVATWDPSRSDGARANRIQEFRAEDLFLDSNVPAQADGTYRVPVSPKGEGCIGLQWLNRRALKELALEFASVAQMPPAKDVRVEGWFGESAWQGQWKALAGELKATGNRLTLQLPLRGAVVQTYKTRWIFPATGTTTVRSLSAQSRSSWHQVNLVVEAEKPAKGAPGGVSIWNGVILADGAQKAGGAGTAQPTTRLKSDFKRPLHLTIRASRPSPLKSDPTLLQFHLPSGAFSVSVEDVLNNKCVYLPDFGIFVARADAGLTLAAYKQKIAERKTLLEQVRALPDQTLEQAMARTHHKEQREGFVSLSLSCDNAKFVVERDGALHFRPPTTVVHGWLTAGGMIQPRFGRWDPEGVKRYLDGGWLPIPVVVREHAGVRCIQRTFVAPNDEAGANPTRLNRRSICVAQFTLTNTLDQATQAELGLDLLADKAKKVPAKLERTQGGYSASSHSGKFALVLTEVASPLKADANGNALTLKGQLSAHGSTSFALFLTTNSEDLSAIPDAERLYAETQGYWKALMDQAMQVETPDPLLNNIIRASQVRCLIAGRNIENGMRVAPAIAAMTYGPLESEAHSVIRGMDFMGHRDFARRGLDYFLHLYNTNGFLTTGYTTFGTAWNLWTVGEHYQLYRETNWLREASPTLKRASDWIIRQTDKTRQTGRPEYGLMPPGVLADWNSFAYHCTMNAYYYAGLHGVGTAWSDLVTGGSQGNDAMIRDHLLSNAAALRGNTLRAYLWTQAQAPALALRNGTWIPHYPSQVHSPGKLAEFFPGDDVGRSWCYDVELGAHQLVPTGVLNPLDREVARMSDHMEDVQFMADGWFDYPASMNEKDWFNNGGFSKVQPYYTRNCEVYALRDDVKPFVRSYFNTIAAMINPEILTVWEHFRHSGAPDKTHETGYFLHQTRTMLVTERGDELWLAPFITSNWLKEGQSVKVANAPTRFGPVAYQLDSHLANGYVRATIQPPTRQAPKSIVLRLRTPEGNPIRSVELNGKRYSDFDKDKGLVRLKPSAQTLRLEVFYR